MLSELVPTPRFARIGPLNNCEEGAQELDRLTTLWRLAGTSSAPPGKPRAGMIFG